MKSTSGLSIWPEELAGVGRQRLDVAALALGVDGVEGERRLARARQPGEDDELVARQLEVDVAQVVLAGAPDPNRVEVRVRHSPNSTRSAARNRTDVRQAIGRDPEAADDGHAVGPVGRAACQPGKRLAVAREGEDPCTAAPGAAAEADRVRVGKPVDPRRPGRPEPAHADPPVDQRPVPGGHGHGQVARAGHGAEMLDRRVEFPVPIQEHRGGRYDERGDE